MGCFWREVTPGHWEPGSLALDEVALVSLRLGGSALLVKPGPHVRVNGEPVLGGLRLLDHRDEVLIGARRWLYSSETVPTIVPFMARQGERLPVCPLCRGPVKPDQGAVCCPGCGRWFHQLDERACWTYAPTCRFCKHPTALDASSAWRPEREDDP